MARESEFYLQRIHIKKIFFLGGGGGGKGGMGSRWMDKQTGTKQFDQSTSSKLGA